MNKEPVDIVNVLKNAIDMLEKYPQEIEELARQLNNITVASNQLAEVYQLPMNNGIVEEP